MVSSMGRRKQIDPRKAEGSTEEGSLQQTDNKESFDDDGKILL
jgi:hypothetical protein